ncbi:hypothetical protein [Treponema bryantii]|uniref:hypothetical protein n=1 Tax=Treponema bryantii TaxID=163 RepID=UPI0003B51D2F|nr:hypothetical protein [Treponema bryantii]
MTRYNFLNTFRHLFYNFFPICYEESLSHYRRHGIKKSLRSQGKKLPGTTGDICTLCDFVCKTIS